MNNVKRNFFRTFTLGEFKGNSLFNGKKKNITGLFAAFELCSK